MDGGIPPIDPLDLEQYARARERDFTDGRRGWLQRRTGPNLVLLVVVAAALIIFLLTR